MHIRHITPPALKNAAYVCVVEFSNAIAQVACHSQHLSVVVVRHNLADLILVNMPPAHIQRNVKAELSRVYVATVDFESVETPSNQWRMGCGVVVKRIHAGAINAAERVPVVVIVKSESNYA